MLRTNINMPVLFLVAAIAGGFAAVPAMAHDDQAMSGYEQHGDNHSAGNHIEGHIAFLKAELGITPAQEVLWSKVAGAMRTDVTEIDNALQQNPVSTSDQLNALQHLEERVTFSALRAQSERRFLDVFRPLYESLSTSQKETADDLFSKREER